MPSKKPNVIFMVTDDQRGGTIHALGNDEIKTPNMDRLVHMGASFMNAYIPGGTTSAVCMPSRAMINSGATLFHLEDCGRNIPKNVKTMGQCFLEAGYHSTGIGKWHNGVESYARSFDGGENIFFGGMWDHWNVPVSDFRADGKYDHEILFTPNFTANETTVPVKADRINAGVHSTELFADSAVKFIDEYDSDKPFFMYLAFLAPHDPRTMPEQFKNMYKAEDISLPPNYMPMPQFSYGWAAKGRDENTEAYPRKPDRIRQHIADYYAMISHIDWHMGRILDALESKGELENTIIVMCGDNGLAVGQHGLMGKQNLYEHSIKVPLVMAGPGIPKDTRITGSVYLLDIFPTLCECCGMDIPETCEGKSFKKMFSDPNAETREYMYFAFQARIRGVSDGRFKLLEYRSPELKLNQLFDLENDPWELQNMFGISGYDGIFDRLEAELLRLRDEWDDEKNMYGDFYWRQWRQYKDAEVQGIPGPKGSNMVTQVKDWGVSKV